MVRIWDVEGEPRNSEYEFLRSGSAFQRERLGGYWSTVRGRMEEGMRLNRCLWASMVYLVFAMPGKCGSQIPDPDVMKKWPTFYEGAMKGTKHLCVEISALKPPPKNPPNPGFYALRYRIYVSKKALTRIDLDRTNLWKATLKPADYVGGTSGQIRVGKHELSASVNGQVDSIRVDLIMQSNISTGEVVADVKECKLRE